MTTKKLLLFGGNGFIGSHTTYKLLEAGYELTLLCRGNWDWDTKTTILPKVNFIKLDRRSSESRTLLQCALAQNNYRFDAVIDFSAFKVRDVEPFYDVIRDYADLYVYISSDSVYEVCVESASVDGVRETDAIRPNLKNDQSLLKKLDSYGHHKLKIEEFLIQKRGEGGLPYVMLRLPDVLGERDGTERVWQYILWIQFANSIGKPVVSPPELCNRLLAFVDVTDVASVVLKLVENHENMAFRDEIFNISYKDPVTLKNLLEAISKALNLDDQKIGEEDRAPHFFPSVCRQKYINIDKIQSVLNFVPTPFDQSITRIVQFYESALVCFPDQRDYAVRSLAKQLSMPDAQTKLLMKAVTDYSAAPVIDQHE